MDREIAAVLAGHGRFMLASVCKTACGVQLPADPIDRLRADVSETDLGAAVRRVLAASRRVIDDPPPGMSAEAYGRPLVRAMGFRSARELCRGAKSINVAIEDGVFKAFPSRGDAKGSALFTGEIVVSPSLSDVDIGHAVREALDRSAALSSGDRPGDTGAR